MRPLAYSVSDVLVMVGISRSNFYRIVKSGKIKVRKIGNRTVVLAVDLDAWLDGLPGIGGKHGNDD